MINDYLVDLEPRSWCGVMSIINDYLVDLLSRS